jgi:hypothetical protein
MRVMLAKQGGGGVVVVATLLEFPGVTQAQYERVGTQLELTNKSRGLLYHACGPADSAWRIMDIWESRQAFDQFVDEVYLPAMRAEGGPSPSRREVITTYHAGNAI